VCFRLARPLEGIRGDREGKEFWLIELLIVVVIIFIIAAIAISNLPGSRMAANEASAPGKRLPQQELLVDRSGNLSRDARPLN
jgi:Tfp pilus assembly protein FimT